METPNIDKLIIRVNNLLDNKIPNSNFDTRFLYEVCKELEILKGSRQAKKDPPVVLSGGTFKDV